MKRTRNWKKAIAVPGGIAILLGGTVFARLAAEPGPVLNRARLFCEVPQWHGQTLYPELTNYFWLSDREAYITAPGGRSGKTLYRLTADPPGRLSAASAVSSELPPGPLLISPDGTRVAYFETDPARGADEATAGSTRVVIRECGGRLVAKVKCDRAEPLAQMTNWTDGLVWSPDGTSLYYLQNGAALGIRRISVRTGKLDTLPAPRELRAMAGPLHVIGCTRRNTLIIAHGGPFFQSAAFYAGLGADGANRSVNFPRLTLVEVSAEAKPKLVRTLSLAVPAGVGMGMIALDPAGERIFWGALCMAPVPPLQKRAHRWLKFVPGEDTLVERGWVSRLDGSEMKQIGYYVVPDSAAANAPDQPWILDPKWTPDGRCIGFVYKDRLMTVAVD